MTCLQMLAFITSTKTLFPSKITVTRSEGQDVCICVGHRSAQHRVIFWSLQMRTDVFEGRHLWDWQICQRACFPG